MSKFVPMTIFDIEDEALNYNCEVIIAKPNELQFDLDGVGWKEKFTRLHETLENFYQHGIREETWQSRNGNLHAVLYLPEELTVEERIALQAMGGSDQGREFAALQCHKAGSPHPILLFKPRVKHRDR